MTIINVVDAFASRPLANENWMKDVALEMNLSETAFLHPIAGGFSLRWPTPAVEVKLCGHATLAVWTNSLKWPMSERGSAAATRSGRDDEQSRNAPLAELKVSAKKVPFLMPFTLKSS